VSDEEQGGEYGAKYLVKNHSSLFTDVRYAIGEFGGFSFYIDGKKYYPIMVSEKQPCLITLRLRGPSGHPTVAFHGGAMSQLGEILHRLEHKHLPVHITPATRMMIQAISTGLSFPPSLVLKQLLNPFFTNRILKLLGKQVEQFEPLLHNTVNATAITGADNNQKIPDDMKLHLVCVMLPGFTPDDMIYELKALIGEDIEVEGVDATFYEPIPSTPDMGLFDTLSGVLRETDQDGIPVPFLLPSPTDGRFFSQLGIQTYGFLPMSLPPDFSFWLAIHAADERIPLDALTFGTDAIYKVIQRFGRD
jgi:acetylornithine deacetylase/succinyl-diaminopimelate desuccinylase-like protein